GTLAKTDAIDAAVLAHFGSALRPPARPLPEAQVRSLDALLTRRRQLLEILTMEGNRLGSCADAAVRADLEAHIAWLNERLGQADKDLRGLIQASPVWREKDELLQSIPGVGPTTSRTLLAALPELGTVSNKEA